MLKISVSIDRLVDGNGVITPNGMLAVLVYGITSSRGFSHQTINSTLDLFRERGHYREITDQLSVGQLDNALYDLQKSDLIKYSEPGIRYELTNYGKQAIGDKLLSFLSDEAIPLIREVATALGEGQRESEHYLLTAHGRDIIEQEVLPHLSAKVKKRLQQVSSQIQRELDKAA